MIYEGNKNKKISFPLGGIGTGCIGLFGNGELNDWEIFNRPNKNTCNGFSHFAIKATQNGRSITKILHGDTGADLTGMPCRSAYYYGYGFGPSEMTMAGYPHFKEVSFDGSFPIAKLTFKDDDFPATVKLFAFNPFIPHNEFDSSLPVAFFEWEIENPTDEAMKIDVAGTVYNPAKSTYNKKVEKDNIKGVYLGSADLKDTDVGYSDLCILTDNGDVAVQEYWYRGVWKDNCTTYFKNLSELERMPERNYSEPWKRDHGTVVAYTEIAPKSSAKIRFVISWNVPIVQNYWKPREEDEGATWKNYYATQWKDSFESGAYALERFSELYEKTATFSDTLQSSSLPDCVKDAISANLSVLKTPTTLRLEDGSFWGWEGCLETAGSCYGTCQHVWNYAYAMPYLFPSLERSIRENTVKYALIDSGATSFRINLPPKRELSTPRACVDGQMGEVIKFYRDWKLSGDDEWLEKYAKDVFKMLEYAWSPDNTDKWDADMDGVLEGRQHHTLDMELFGPSSWLQGLYLLALDCGAEMANYLGDEERHNLYTSLYTRGKKWMNDNLFNGKCFYQKTELSDKTVLDAFGAGNYWNKEAGEIKYQIGEGSIIDQMLADWHAHLIGKKCVFDKEKKDTALRNLYKTNYKPSMRNVANMWRNFAINDEAGTVMCAYPDGVRVPAIPIPYCDETMAGFEYALAGLMISEGYIAEGERIVKSVRDRYDGEKRNPWNEFECGSNYARSMSSYALLPIYSGFSFDMTKKHIGFSPIQKTGKYLFSVCDSWGYVNFEERKCVISILGNPLELNSISIPGYQDVAEVIVDGKRVDFELADGRLALGNVDIQKEICFIQK